MNSSSCCIALPYDSSGKKQRMKEAAVLNSPPVKLADEIMSVKKGKICSYLNYNIVSFGKMTGKQNLLAIEKICC